MFDFEKIKEITNIIIYNCETNKYNFPEESLELLQKICINRVKEFTYALQIWIEKVNQMTDGELILAKVNLGALVEGWLALFYIFYYKDYVKKPMITKKGKTIKLEKLTFSGLKEFSIGKLYKKNNCIYKWIYKIQHQRNNIHLMVNSDAGTNQRFLEDLKYFEKFLELVESHLPDIIN